MELGWSLGKVLNKAPMFYLNPYLQHYDFVMLCYQVRMHVQQSRDRLRRLAGPQRGVEGKGKGSRNENMITRRKGQKFELCITLKYTCIKNDLCINSTVNSVNNLLKGIAIIYDLVTLPLGLCQCVSKAP